MTDDDKREFAVLIAATAEAYDVPVLSKSRLAMLFEDLREFSLDQVAEGLRRHRQASKWFPKVSELIEHMLPSHEQAALVAWADLVPRLRDSRNAMSPDPVAERVVQDLGGWLRLGATDTDKLTWIEKEFVRRYEMYAQHGTDLPLQIGHRSGLQRITH